jgi:hypothetical protein
MKSIYWVVKNTTKKGTYVLLVASKPTGIEQNAEKTTYTVMSRDQNAIKTHTVRTVNKSFQRVKQPDIWNNPDN